MYPPKDNPTRHKSADRRKDIILIHDSYNCYLKGYLGTDTDYRIAEYFMLNGRWLFK